MFARTTSFLLESFKTCVAVGKSLVNENELKAPAMVAVSGVLLNKVIQTSRLIEGQGIGVIKDHPDANVECIIAEQWKVKTEIKNGIALASSAACAIALGTEAIALTRELVKDRSKLTREQCIVIGATTLTALAGLGYAMANFAVEQTQETSALATAASLLLFSSAKNLAKYYAGKNDQAEGLLPRALTVV